MRIRISAIGVDSALIALGLAADGTLTLQVPVDGSVAGWFTGSPTPGEHGPSVIAAHVDWNHAPGVFFHLRDLEPGAEVAVDRADGTTARFEVLKVEQYPKDAFPTERVYGDIDHAGLRLIPCGGSFDRAARSYRDNVVVYAGLVGSSAGLLLPDRAAAVHVLLRRKGTPGRRLVRRTGGVIGNTLAAPTGGPAIRTRQEVARAARWRTPSGAAAPAVQGARARPEV